VWVDVSLGLDLVGGFCFIGIMFIVCGEVDGLDVDGFVKVVEEVKVICLVSKVLIGVDISLDVVLEV